MRASGGAGLHGGDEGDAGGKAARMVAHDLRAAIRRDQAKRREIAGQEAPVRTEGTPARGLCTDCSVCVLLNNSIALRASAYNRNCRKCCQRSDV